MPGGQEIKTKLTGTLALQPVDFEYRWAAD